MRNRFLAIQIVFFLFIHAAALGQWQWAIQGKSGDGKGKSVSVDSVGNIYATISYNDSLHLWNNSYVKKGLLLAKFTNTGQLIGGSPFNFPFFGSSTYAISMEMQKGNIYFTGSDDTSLFLSTYDTALHVTKKFKNFIYATKVFPDDSNGVYVYGGANYDGPCIDTFCVRRPGFNWSEHVIAHVNGNGKVKWMKNSNGANNAYGAMQYANNTLYCFMANDSAFTFDTLQSQLVPFLPSAFPVQTIFCALQSNGSLKWSMPINDANINFLIDSKSSMYFAGNIDSSIAFSDDSLRHISGTATNFYLVKLDSNRHVAWSRILSSTNIVSGGPMVMAANGEIFMYAAFLGQFTVDGFTITSTQTKPGAVDHFVARFDTNGVCKGLVALPFADYRDFAVDAQGAVYFTGSLNPGDNHFGSYNLHVDVNQGSDFFLAKLAQVNGIRETPKQTIGELRIFASPNHGTFTIQLPNGDAISEEASIKLVDEGGAVVRVVKQAVNPIHLGEISRGTYMVEVRQAGNTYVGRVVIQ
ncbi:MAG: T9SS type A sorting domain-containing protein [Chitinophagales bacterium]